MESTGPTPRSQKVSSAIMEHTVSLERPFALNQAASLAAPAAWCRCRA